MRTIDSDLYLHRATLRRETVPSFEVYPFHLPVIRQFEALEFTEPVTFFVGENGSGNRRCSKRLPLRGASMRRAAGRTSISFRDARTRSSGNTCG